MIKMVYEAYNLTGGGMHNASGIVELMQTVNSELMFDFYGIGILLSIFLIAFFAFHTATGGNATKAMAGASFISFGISLLLIILDLIPNYSVYLLLILAAVSVVFIKER